MVCRAECSDHAYDRRVTRIKEPHLLNCVDISDFRVISTRLRGEISPTSIAPGRWRGFLAPASLEMTSTVIMFRPISTEPKRFRGPYHPISSLLISNLQSPVSHPHSLLLLLKPYQQPVVHHLAVRHLIQRQKLRQKHIAATILSLDDQLIVFLGDGHVFIFQKRQMDAE